LSTPALPRGPESGKGGRERKNFSWKGRKRFAQGEQREQQTVRTRRPTTRTAGVKGRQGNYDRQRQNDGTKKKATVGINRPRITTGKIRRGVR